MKIVEYRSIFISSGILWRNVLEPDNAQETASTPRNEVYNVEGRQVKVYLCWIICSRAPWT